MAIAARVVIRHHGADAFDHAKRMAHRYSKTEDKTAAREWLQIMRVIGEIKAVQSKKRFSPGETAKPAA